MAVATTWSPSTVPQSLTTRLEVIRMLPRSATADELEQQVRRGGLEWPRAEFVEDQQPRLAQL